jgi:hypothetical protein
MKINENPPFLDHWKPENHGFSWLVMGFPHLYVNPSGPHPNDDLGS